MWSDRRANIGHKYVTTPGGRSPNGTRFPDNSSYSCWDPRYPSCTNLEMDTAMHRDWLVVLCKRVSAAISGLWTKLCASRKPPAFTTVFPLQSHSVEYLHKHFTRWLSLSAALSALLEWMRLTWTDRSRKRQNRIKLLWTSAEARYGWYWYSSCWLHLLCTYRLSHKEVSAAKVDGAITNENTNR